jgi:putative flippase GtrA
MAAATESVARQPRVSGQLARFAGIGVASTAAYAVVYLLLRPVVGAFGANALSLLLTAIANTAANRRLTFGVQGGSGAAGDHAVGLAAFVAGLALTSGALAVLRLAAPRAPHLFELGVLLAASVAATVLRFVALRLRLHHRAPGRPAAVGVVGPSVTGSG